MFTTSRCSNCREWKTKNILNEVESVASTTLSLNAVKCKSSGTGRRRKCLWNERRGLKVIFSTHWNIKSNLFRRVLRGTSCSLSWLIKNIDNVYIREQASQTSHFLWLRLLERVFISRALSQGFRSKQFLVTNPNVNTTTAAKNKFITVCFKEKRKRKLLI